MHRNIILLIFALAAPPAVARDDGEARAACRRAVFSGLLAPSTAKFQAETAFVVASVRDPARMSQVSDWLLGNVGQGGRAILELDRRFNLLKADEMLDIDGRIRRGDAVGADRAARVALARTYAHSEQAVLGYVDAQNVFGAMIRHSFVCLGAERRGAWAPDRLLVLP